MLNKTQSNRLDRIEKKLRIRHDSLLPYIAFGADEWHAMSDEQRGAVNAHKIYVGVSPNDWDDDDESTIRK